ncbi:hypothetical protein UO65_5469 [Actinokineospora spheciospongiae]|uniref:Uncharacterized protein n=1 Tax=Actinokineospora spheciospongiae TaxID=909613 RepID=W7IG14_9PSEU|nr:hypothetical protein [Actinokineospora spheciospongiae]EWC59253.1 hypothetical protein UO65_5469 [Actinokineospora spheciospongiae]
MERWEDLQSRLFHLGYLGEELEYFATDRRRGAWLYRQIAVEAFKAAEVADAYAQESYTAESFLGGDQ